MKTLLSASLALLTSPLVFGQGAITPPAGPPAASMKTLDEIAALAAATDPRTIVGEPTGFYTISASGSYRLASNRVAPAGNVSIIVDAPDVVIDLNGFTISSGGAGSRAIDTNSNARRLTVINGTITGCAGAVDGTGTAGAEILHVENVKAIDCTGAVFRAPANSLIADCQIRGVAGTTTAISCGAGSTVRNTRVNLVNGYGISVGANSVIKGCTVSGSTFPGITATTGALIDRCEVSGMTGTGNLQAILAGDGSSVTNTVSRGNVAFTGITVGNNSKIEACVASGNTNPSLNSYGIFAGDGSTILNCTSSGNLSGAAASQQAGAGFFVGDSTTIKDCTASENRGPGIWLQGRGSYIANNTLSNNGAGAGGVGAGIAIGNAAQRNRIEGNTAIGNRTGFLVFSGSTQNFFVRNTAGNNATANWTITSGNYVAPITAPASSPDINGNTGGTAFGSTDPNANFSL